MISFQEGGEWDLVLSCEIPVLVIAGGVEKSMKEVKNSLEVVSVFPGEGCDNLEIPEMLVGNGMRSLHNLAYNPMDSGKEIDKLFCWKI